ncbi:hypothetical protein MRB53_006497 [Persea americana]|uniref:Uncharacterized protein n=1 Tax=Persea americana TaxID=3435 RepID=A0ACC2MGI4_PERAE|nr:hypothetical protein MRB53_006497 [Persea americana]
MAMPYVPEHKEPLSIIEKGWKSSHLTQYQGFWLPLKFLSGVMACPECFEACKEDLILNTTPKSGTTWLKALTFTILNRARHDFHNHPLLTTNPRALVPYLDLDLYAEGKIPDLTNLPSPRLFSLHLPYELLPTSIIKSNCRIIYLWYFENSFLLEDEPPVSIDEAFELFHGGISTFEPFWEHLLVYWKASLERPERVLFMKYEEHKEDPTFHLRRFAEFLGCPLSIEEERHSLVEKMERFCSFESLTSLEVNKIDRGLRCV